MAATAKYGEPSASQGSHRPGNTGSGRSSLGLPRHVRAVRRCADAYLESSHDIGGINRGRAARLASTCRVSFHIVADVVRGGRLALDWSGVASAMALSRPEWSQVELRPRQHRPPLGVTLRGGARGLVAATFVSSRDPTIEFGAHARPRLPGGLGLGVSGFLRGRDRPPKTGVRLESEAIWSWCEDVPSDQLPHAPPDVRILDAQPFCHLCGRNWLVREDRGHHPPLSPRQLHLPCEIAQPGPRNGTGPLRIAAHDHDFSEHARGEEIADCFTEFGLVPFWF
jgi:hypothetical protein